MIGTEYKYSPKSIEEFAETHDYTYQELFYKHGLYKIRLLKQWQKWREQFDYANENKTNTLEFIFWNVLSSEERQIVAKYANNKTIYDIADEMKKQRDDIRNMLEDINNKIKDALDVIN